MVLCERKNREYHEVEVRPVITTERTIATPVPSKLIVLETLPSKKAMLPLAEILIGDS